MNPERITMYEAERCIRAAEFLRDHGRDSDAIDAAIQYARQVQVPFLLLDEKDWNLDRAIEVPSGFRMVADGVRVKLNDGVFDNIFRPDTVICREDDPYGFPMEIKPSQHIQIQGKNGAVLEGPDNHPQMFDPVQQRTREMIGDEWGWRGFLIFMPRCTGFEIGGFLLRKTRTWAISVERSSQGWLHDLEFRTECKNGDGINLRMGCSHIRIENIRGYTSDDMIALNSGAAPLEYPREHYLFPLVPSSYLIREGEPIEDRYIHDIQIRNVRSATRHYSEAVAFLSNGGHKIYRIQIRDIYDDNPVEEPKRLNLVGAYYLDYGPGFREGDLAEITIDHVEANSTEQALMFRLPIRDLRINRVIQNCKTGVVLLATEKNIHIPLPNCISASGRLTAPAEKWVFCPKE